MTTEEDNPENWTEEYKAVERQWQKIMANAASLPKTKKQQLNELSADIEDLITEAETALSLLRGKLIELELLHEEEK